MKTFYIQKNPPNTKPAPARVMAGFTLLEVLVAITVLAFAITATFTAAQSGLSAAENSKDQVVGFYLAQEAVEYIRNLRDDNALLNESVSTNWLAGFAQNPSDVCYPGKACSVDVVANKLTACPSGPGTCAALVEDLNSADATYGMYGDAYNSHGANWKTVNYKREVTITTINSNEIAITVNVTVTKGSSSQVFTVRENILNWQT